ncbi:MAG TPA: secretin N-terminal domain-containing protein, partial [Phycisphaerales bacterium]|nr:secretin N-terminal domain-containing protein [Phycisphaerales bacterium]
MRVFALSKTAAADVAAAVRTAVSAGLRPGEAAPVVTPEPGSNSVVVSAAPDRLARAEEVVRALDGAGRPDGLAVRTIALAHARAESVAPMVQTLLRRESVLEQIPQWQKLEFLRSQQPQGSPPAALRAVAEPRLNAVVVTGPVALIEVAEQIVRELDVSPAGGGGRSVRVLTLTGADAAELAASLAAVFQEEGEGAAPTIRVDAASNSLIVRAGEAQMRTVEELVTKLDAAAVAGSRELRLISLDPSRARAGAVAEALRRLLDDRGAPAIEIVPVEELMKREGGPGPVPPTSPDRRQGLTVPLHLPGIVAIAVMAAPGAPPTPAAAPPPDPAPARPVEAPLTIAVDEASNSLVVVGPARLTQRVAALAGQLEKQMPAEPGRVRLVTLPESADARALAQAITAAVRQIGTRSEGQTGGFTSRVAVEADPAGGALIVSANETDFAVLGELIGALARPGPATTLTVKVYPLTNTTAQRALRAATDLLAPAPRGAQARRLLALDVPGPNGTPAGAPIPFDPASVRLTADP